MMTCNVISPQCFWSKRLRESVTFTFFISIVGIAYLTEFFISWYSGVEYESYAFINRATGPYWWAYTSMMTCNVISPQLFWIRKLRRNVWFTFFMSIVINCGMWFERFVIIVTSIHRDYIPSSWAMYHPTWVEISFFLGSLGLFSTAFLIAPIILSQYPNFQ